MSQVRIQLPPGVEVDKTRLTSAVRFALQGSDPGKIWKLNPVPAIAQLEEATYDEGMQDLADLYEEVVTGLDLPPDQQAMAVLNKALARQEVAAMTDDHAEIYDQLAAMTDEQAAEIYDQLAKAFRWGRKPPPGQVAMEFEENDHPREKAGETLPGYKPGEFIPKDKTPGGKGPDTQAEPQKPLPDEGKASLPSFEDRIKAANEEFALRCAEIDAQVEQIKQLEAKAQTAGELEALKQERVALYDETGIAWKRHRNKLDNLNAEMNGGQPGPNPEEMRTRARAARLEDRELSRQFVPMSDPRRVALREEGRRLFITADQMEGMHSEYLFRQATKISREAAQLRKPWTQQAIDAQTDAERDTALAHIEEITNWEIDTSNEFSARGEWQQEAEKEKQDQELRDALGDEEYNRIKREEAAAKEYQRTHKPTGVGYDRRQPFDPKHHERSVKAFRPLGRPMTKDECEKAGLPRGTYDLTQDETEEGIQHSFVGDYTVIHGPRKDKVFQAEARAMQDRVHKAFPAWLRQHMESKGVTQHYSALAPARTPFTNQADFYQWLKQNPQTGSGINPDQGGGVYYHARKAAWTVVGDSFPGGRGGSLCTEIHEYAHAVDYNFRENGLPIHKLPEWEQIVRDMAPYVDSYNQRPQELFAEGLTAFLWDKKARKQMLQGPPQWRRMGAFFQALMDDRRGPDQIKKALWIPGWEFTKALDSEAEDGSEETERHEGMVWKPGIEMPAPDGNGFMIVDGWGFPEASE